MDDFDENIFDEDDALDYLIYEDMEKPDRSKMNQGGGCLGMLLILVCPVVCLVLGAAVINRC